jgi:hypothetical protein
MLDRGEMRQEALPAQCNRLPDRLMTEPRPASGRDRETG